MNSQTLNIPILTSIAEVSLARKAWFCDVWGVLHNGETVFEPAAKACLTFRERGGTVVLISNSPRPSPGLLELFRGLGVSENVFDVIVTSGDVTRALVADRSQAPIYHLGPERDRVFFDGLHLNFAPAGRASIVVCTGLFDDENETPADYDEMLQAFADRGVLMICANPDLVVERGNRLLPCAGALAARYASLGGKVIQAGKPFAPIYELAFRKLPSAIGKKEILAIGDGIDTDIKGAAELGLDAVYIASHVHLRENMAGLTEAALRQLFEDRPFRPIAAMPHLAW